MSPEEVKEREPLRLQVLEKLAQLMTAAFGLIAALAWNDAIKSFMAGYFAAGTGTRALMVYALLVTILAVVVAIWIGAAIGRAKKLVTWRRAPPPTTQSNP